MSGQVGAGHESLTTDLAVMSFLLVVDTSDVIVKSSSGFVLKATQLTYI